MPFALLAHLNPFIAATTRPARAGNLAEVAGQRYRRDEIRERCGRNRRRDQSNKVRGHFGSAVYIRGNTAASIGPPPGPAPRSILLCASRYRTIKMDYHDGLRYPHLERTPNVPARLDQIFGPRN